MVRRFISPNCAGLALVIAVGASLGVLNHFQSASHTVSATQRRLSTQNTEHRCDSSRPQWRTRGFEPKKGFELGEGNHGSPPGCNTEMLAWFRFTFASRSLTKVLDVGGGKGAIAKNIAQQLPDHASFEYSCIDVTPSKACGFFDGNGFLGECHAEKSADIVMFNYVLHHAGDSTIGLLKHAAKVARNYVIVQEDLKGKDRREAMTNFGHEWAGTFRGEKEWRQIFDLLGMTLVHIAYPDPRCAYAIGRVLFVLKP